MESKTPTECCQRQAPAPAPATQTSEAGACCPAPSPRTDNAATQPQAGAKVDIEFLYLDLTSCSRCCGTDENLQAALQLLQPVLNATGAQVNVRKTRIVSEAQAQAIGFVSSPTLRINGRDIAGELAEDVCSDCSALCHSDTPVNCRVWHYHGSKSTQAPVGLIVESVLRAIYGDTPAASTERRDQPVPENLKRYFSGTTPACGTAA